MTGKLKGVEGGRGGHEVGKKGVKGFVGGDGGRISDGRLSKYIVFIHKIIKELI